MAAVGRRVDFTWDGAQIPGTREKGMSLNGEPLDISDSASDGWAVMIDVHGERDVTISVSGVTNSSVLREAWFSQALTKPATITYPLVSGETTAEALSGNFTLMSYSETAPYNDLHVFEAEIKSSGPVTRTPAA